MRRRATQPPRRDAAGSGGRQAHRSRHAAGSAAESRRRCVPQGRPRPGRPPPRRRARQPAAPRLRHHRQPRVPARRAAARRARRAGATQREGMARERRQRAPCAHAAQADATRRLGKELGFVMWRDDARSAVFFARARSDDDGSTKMCLAAARGQPPDKHSRVGMTQAVRTNNVGVGPHTHTNVHLLQPCSVQPGKSRRACGDQYARSCVLPRPQSYAARGRRLTPRASATRSRTRRSRRPRCCTSASRAPLSCSSLPAARRG